MLKVFDVIIVGSGPSGVSAAFPLLDAGLNILMIDGGSSLKIEPPNLPYFNIKYSDNNKFKWMVGDDFHSLKPALSTDSPKLRVPIHAPIFENYNTLNKLDPSNFVSIGSLSPGGLSNAWGSGVSCFDSFDLSEYPISKDELDESYKIIAKRIGISGSVNDDLSNFFGLDLLSQSPIPIDELQSSILNKYNKRKFEVINKDFRIGRSRVAVLTEKMLNRDPCDLSGNCLWGCNRGAIYNSLFDLKILKDYTGFNYRSGYIVDSIINNKELVVIKGSSKEGSFEFTSKKLMLGCGTLASTRLAFQAIDYRESVHLQSCPTAGFLLWLPSFFNRSHSQAFGLGQLSFVLDLPDSSTAYGSLYNCSGIPVHEFLRFLPFGKRNGINFLNPLLSSCVVGNIFLSGKFSDTYIKLMQDNRLKIDGNYSNQVNIFMNFARNRLRSSFMKLGAVLIPNSFSLGSPGSDIHYSSSLPMRIKPKKGETDCIGLVCGLNNVHIIDGACLSSLPSKPHTLTIMANADRISRSVVRMMK